MLRAYHHRTEHVQIADWPGRHEPGTGSMDFLSLFNMLQQRDYSGWVGCEYQSRKSASGRKQPAVTVLFGSQ